MICSRCVAQNDGCQINDSVNGFPVKKMVCSTCSFCHAVSVDDKWETIDDILKDNHPDGFRDAHGVKDLIVHYVLSQILYVLDDAENPIRCLFDKPDPTDRIRFLVKSGRVIGYYTVKPKGTLIEYTYDTYDLTTLDTVYIIAKYRGNGLGVNIVEDLVSSYPDEDIGVSKPISVSMMKVFQKYLIKRPDHRFKFWEIGGAGGEGRRKLLFLEISKILKN